MALISNIPYVEIKPAPYESQHRAAVIVAAIRSIPRIRSGDDDTILRFHERVRDCFHRSYPDQHISDCPQFEEDVGRLYGLPLVFYIKALDQACHTALLSDGNTELSKRVLVDTVHRGFCSIASATLRAVTNKPE